MNSNASQIDSLSKSKQELLYFSEFLNSSINSRVNYEDTASTIFVEDWNDLTNWSASNGVQVLNNKLHSTGIGGSSSGINYPFPLLSNEKARIVFKIDFPDSVQTSGGLIIGVSKDNIGSIPATSASKVCGLYFNKTGVQQVVPGLMSELTTPNTTPYRNCSFNISIIIDELYISVVGTHTTDTSIEVSMRMLRAGFDINNIFIFNSDSRNMNGASVGKLGARKSLSTIHPKQNIEDSARTIHHTGDGTNNFKIYLPKNYDSRKTYPCIIAFHGSGTNETSWSTNGNMLNVQQQLVAQGFIFLSCSYSLSFTTWGNSLSTRAYYKAYKYLIKNYSISSVGIYANSMGGIESLNALVNEQIPCSCWVGTAPAINLKNNYDGAYKSIITDSYGIALNGTNYLTKTIGRDPMLVSPEKFRGLPMLFISATDDAVISSTENTDLFCNKNSSFLLECKKINVPAGGHSFNNTPYLDEISRFFKKYMLNILN